MKKQIFLIYSAFFDILLQKKVRQVGLKHLCADAAALTICATGLCLLCENLHFTAGTVET